MVFSVEGRVTEARAEQDMNERTPIFSNPSGSEAVLILV